MPRVLDVDADLAWALGLVLIAVLAIVLGWILLRNRTQ